MTHDGLALLLRRTFLHIAEVTALHSSRIAQAAEADYAAMFSSPSIAPAMRAQLSAFTDSIKDAEKELLELESYWQTLPWSTMFAHADPRPVKDACVSGEKEIRTHKAADSFDHNLPSPKRVPSPDATTANLGVEGEIIGRGSCGGYPFSTTHTSSPRAEFEPAALAAASVARVRLCTDVRTRTTVGQSDVEFVVGGPPVCWLVAQDGREVAVLRKDFAQLGNIFSAAQVTDQL